MSLLFHRRFSLLEVIVAVALVVSVVSYSAKQKIFDTERGLVLPDVSLGREDPKENGSYKYEKNYAFSADWFSEHIPVWTKALAEYRGKPGVNYLEVGVFEGRAMLWMLENILTAPDSRATVIDVFEGKYNQDYPEFVKRYFGNLRLSGKEDRVTTIHEYSQLALRKLDLQSFDIIYIDGSHENWDVLEDAILAMRLLKPGGVLIFDDYGRESKEYTAPKFGIDAFYRFNKDRFQVLHVGHQVVLRLKSL